jgi:hypothetical protein
MEWPDGEAQWSDQGGPRYPMGEQGRRTPRWVTGAQRRMDRCPTEGGVSEGGPTKEHINGGGP